MNTEPILTTFIPISYETDNYKVSFSVEFGKSKDADKCNNSNIRTVYNTPYEINKYTIDDKNMYCLLAEEGSFALKVYDVNVISKNNSDKRKIHNGYITYNYGLAVVLDINNEPIYNNSTTFVPSNDLERDGVPWVVYNNKELIVDQNGHATFQWSTARALEKGVKPTAEQEEMGVEERHENSGMIYITFHPVYTEETHIIEEKEPVSRGLTRGFTPHPSYAARVGYGSKAETKSQKSSAKTIENSRFILPIRIRNIGETSSNTKCAKDLQSALRVEELQKRTAVLPDY